MAPLALTEPTFQFTLEVFFETLPLSTEQEPEALVVQLVDPLVPLLQVPVTVAPLTGLTSLTTLIVTVARHCLCLELVHAELPTKPER